MAIRSTMYILLAFSAFKVDSGYHSKRSEPFLQIMASKDTELFHDVQKYSLSVAIRPVQFARIFNLDSSLCAGFKESIEFKFIVPKI